MITKKLNKIHMKANKQKLNYKINYINKKFKFNKKVKEN